MLLLLLLFNVLPSSFPQVCDHNQDGYGDDDHKDGRDHCDDNSDDTRRSLRRSTTETWKSWSKKMTLLPLPGEDSKF